MSRGYPLLPGVAFVTGGARGLGLAIAESFAKDGVRGVAIFDIQPQEIMDQATQSIEKLMGKDGKCIAIRGDVTKLEDLESAMDQVVKHFGRLDYAANFAGIPGPLKPTAETSLQEMKKVFDVNTFGVWLSMKVEMAQMLKQDSLSVESGRVEQRGAIVNAASVNSIQAGAGVTGYTGTKHAVLGMTKAMALEGRSQGVRINCVSPGFLETKLLENEMKPQEGQTNATLQRHIWEGYEARQGRIATFDEIGDVVASLCSPRFSLVVGHNLVIDGGFTINENAR